MSQRFCVYPALRIRAACAPPVRRWPMILNALVELLKHRPKDNPKGRCHTQVYPSVTPLCTPECVTIRLNLAFCDARRDGLTLS